MSGEVEATPVSIKSTTWLVVAVTGVSDGSLMSISTRSLAVSIVTAKPETVRTVVPAAIEAEMSLQN
jgi:hypothetical protein